MDQASRQQLATMFEFATWKSPPRGAVRLSIGPLFEPGSKVGRWLVRRAQALTVPGARAAQRSLWQESPSSETILRLDLIEAASATAARELVLELLGQFQSPQIRRQASPRAGDLAFTTTGDTLILFARGNVVAIVRNAGRTIVKVVDFARLVDGRLAQRPGSTPPGSRRR